MYMYPVAEVWDNFKDFIRDHFKTINDLKTSPALSAAAPLAPGGPAASIY